MTQEQLILFKRSINIYNTETEAWTALDNLTHIQGQPVVVFFRRNSNTHGDTALGAIFAIGTANGVGKYKACSSHDDMLAVLQALNTHILEWTAFKDTFDKMFEYDANHKAIKAKLDFYTDSNKNISAGGLGGSGSSSLGALYQLVDVMINSTGDGVEGAAEGSVLAYDNTAGKWKAIAQSEILPSMSNYYTKEETDAAINAIPSYTMSELSASEIANFSDGANVREAYRLKKGGNNVDDTVIKIYKDSAIKNLELRDNKYLVLTYTDNEGNEQSISKDLSVIVNDNYVDLINNQEIGGIKTFTEKTIFKKDINVAGDAVVGGEVVAIAGDAEPVGVTNYAQLQGKPSINGKELASGDNTLEALGIQPKGDYATKAAVNAIQALIPATASADNQLADKDFVNSSIATATAEFRGTFTSLDELKATSGNLNDYAFYLHTDSVGNSIVDRYKWTTAGWLYEYTLNNSSFTAEQWAALNSAITATLVQSYNSHLNNSTIHITAAERTAWNNKWDYNEEIIKAVKVNAAGSADYASSAGDADTLDGYHSSHFLYSPSPRNFADGTFIQTNITFIDGTIFYVEICSNGYGTGIINSRFQGYYFQTSLINCDSTHLGTTAITGFVAMNYNGKLAFWFPRQGYWCGYRVFVSDVSDSATQYNRVTSVTNSTKPTNSYEYTFSDGNINAFITSNVASATKLATARKIWGKYFDGSSDVSGDLTEVGNISASGKAIIQGDIVCGGEVVAIAGEGTPAGVTDYSALTGKPSINGVTLMSGNNTLAALGIQAAGDYATNSGVTTLLANYADKTFVSNNYAGKSAFNAHTADSDIHITSSERTAWNAKWDYKEATIKAVKVTSASSADSVAWSGITGKPTTFTPSAHTHTASEISGLPTNLSAFTNDVGFITGITKSMVEGVLTGDITSHTHTFASLTSKPTTIAGYGITDALTTSNYNSYAPTLTGTGASGTWEISISGNAATATNTTNADNSDTLDGLHASSFARMQYDNNLICHSNEFNFTPTAYKGDVYINYRTMGGLNGAITGYIFADGAGNTLAIITNGNFSGNSASATKLQTPRTVWGQSFDGASDVSGDILLGVGSDYTIGTGYNSSDRLIYNKITIGNSTSGIIYSAGAWTLNPIINVHTFKTAISSNALVINNGGNVLIGTTTDNGYKLQVNGSERVYGDLIVDGEVSALVA